MALRGCRVSFTSSTGVRHFVDVTAESLYEAGAIGLSLLRQDGWVSSIGPGTQLEIEVKSPVVVHALTVAQIRRWCEGIAVSPDEVLKRRRIRDLLGI